MKENTKSDYCSQRRQRGSAGIKLVVILMVLFLIANAGFNFVPVAYSGENFKQEMHTAVLQGFALPNAGDPVGKTKVKIRSVADVNNIPPDALIEVKLVNNVLQAHVAYSKSVEILPFGLYTYNYHFDHTATPNGFLTK
jgi:hypothetical protein